MKLFSILLFFVSFIFALDVEMAGSTISNGQTTIIEFKKEKGISYSEIVVDKKKYKIFKNPKDNDKFYALLPISYYQKPSKKKVEVFYKQGDKQKSKTLLLHVKDANYKKENLKVDGSKVTLNKKDKQRASKEYAEAMKIYKTVNEKSYISSEFIVPLKSKITSDFGKARVYNGSLKGYHSGTDFRADVGTPLLACNDGKIVLVKDRFYSGGSVVIDHGHGVYSCYFHMSRFDVKQGTLIKKGDVIGLSGDTGRVTGPHLHFAMRVAGEQVDPLQFIELINKNIFTTKD